MNRLKHFYRDDPQSAVDRVREAAAQLESEYMEAVRGVVTGEPFDPQELIQLGAGVGRPPGRVYIDLRIAGIAYENFMRSVGPYYG